MNQAHLWRGESYRLFENRIFRQLESPSEIWDQILEFQKPIHHEAKEV